MSKSPRLTPDEGLAVLCAFVLIVLGAMSIIGPPRPVGAGYVGAALCAVAVVAVAGVGVSVRRRRNRDQ